MAFAAPLSDMAGEKSAEAVSVLTQLGVVKGYPDGTYKPGNIVTRAEMAVIVVSALGLADYAKGTSSFSDMGGHWSNGFVAYATSLGIIAGYPDGTFKPDKTVSYDEAATMLVAALGYNADSLIGTWPANFVTKAKTLGILDGIVAGAAGANRGDIAIMAYQTLDQAIGKTNKDGDFVYDKDAAGDPTDTMLARLGVGLYDPDGAGAAFDPGDAFVVTGDEDSVINLKPFLGAYVTAYEDDDDIIAIKEVKSVYLTGEFDVVGAVAAGDTFEATDKDYTLDVVTFAAPVSFTNGADDAVYTAPVGGTDYTMAVKVSGSKIKEIYSVAVWTQDGDFLYEDDMLEDDNLNAFDFTLDDDDEIDLDSFDLVGVDSLADIDEDNVVYVYTSAGEITKIEVGTEVVKGEVTKISNDDKKITVDGKAYEYADDNFAALTNAVSKGSVDLEDDVVLYLDVNGYIYDMDVNAKDGGNYAIILETADEVAGLGGDNAMVKLFLADGSDKTFDVDGDVVVATLIDAAGAWTVGAAAGGILVEYGVDGDGVIDYLKDMTVDANFNSAPATDKELTAKLTYNGVPVASDAILFTADVTDPAFDPQDEDFYGVTTVAKAKGSEFKADYYAKNNKITLMVVQGTGTDTDIVYGVVKSWAKTTASATDYTATLLVDGDSVDYDIKTAVYTQLNGDANAKKKIYEITFNTAGEVTALTDVSAGVATEIDILDTLTPSVAYANGALDGTTIDVDAVAYMMETGETSFVKVSISKANLVGMTKVVLYDVDEDDVADILLITE